MSLVVESHSEYRALLRQVILSPGDDSPRHALADWLEIHGDAPRAEFIRLQLELVSAAPCPTNQKGVGTPNLCCRRCDLQTRLFDLLIDHGRRLAINGDPGSSIKIKEDFSKITVAKTVSHFDRGFIWKVELKCEAFLAGAREMFERHPLSHVVLNDRHPVNLPGGRAMWLADGSPGAEPQRNRLPSILFDQLPGGAGSKTARLYDSSDDATDALSIACVAHGRKLAGVVLSDEPNSSAGPGI